MSGSRPEPSFASRISTFTNDRIAEICRTGPIVQKHKSPKGMGRSFSPPQHFRSHGPRGSATLDLTYLSYRLLVRVDLIP